MSGGGTRPLRICVDARLAHGTSGGLEQVVIGLAAGLSGLTDGDEEYLFLLGPDGGEWLRPYLGRNCRAIAAPRPSAMGPRARLAAAIPWAARVYGAAHDVVVGPSVSLSDGRAEACGADVVHLTHQEGFVTRIPSIYHPHDLQHVHLPQFFTRRQRRRRDVLFRTLAAQASLVAVGSSWVKGDVERHLGVPGDKVAVIPLAPVIGHYPRPAAEAIDRVRAKLDLPGQFALYPAQTWPHKNHVRLLDALALLRDAGGAEIPLVASGHLNVFHAEIAAHARRLGLQRVRFVGFVSPEELRALYALARCVVIPSLFEAGSFPLWEAFDSGVPAACSTVTSLPRQAGDAAVLFDPRDTQAMASAIRRVWEDEALRASLVARGRARLAHFSWDRTARLFRAHYRRIAGRQLSEHDQALLAEAPLM